MAEQEKPADEVRTESANANRDHDGGAAGELVSLRAQGLAASFQAGGAEASVDN